MPSHHEHAQEMLQVSLTYHGRSGIIDTEATLERLESLGFLITKKPQEFDTYPDYEEISALENFVEYEYDYCCEYCSSGEERSVDSRMTLTALAEQGWRLVRDPGVTDGQ